jgi:hypothetical protein
LLSCGVISCYSLAETEASKQALKRKIPKCDIDVGEITEITEMQKKNKCLSGIGTTQGEDKQHKATQQTT